MSNARPYYAGVDGVVAELADEVLRKRCPQPDVIPASC